MDNAGYVALTRQTGLLREMRLVANNVANANTTGFRAQSITFSEHIKRAGPAVDSLSMSDARVDVISRNQGVLTQTGGAFDLAIEGEGYFLIGTADGERLTRAGHFTTDPYGALVTQDGDAVLDAGGAPILLPPSNEKPHIARDGSISLAGQPVAQVGLVIPTDPDAMIRVGSTSFDAREGWEPAPAPMIHQGALEGSNVDPINQIARMVEIQRAYELGQKFLERENERINGVINTLGR